MTHARIVAAAAALLLVASTPVPEMGQSARDDLVFERLGGVRLPADAAFERTLSHGAPLPEDSVGIGPGSTVITNVDYAGGAFTGVCTAAFVFEGADGTAYLAAAGHCFLDEGFAATHGPGADWNPGNVARVRVCVADCIGGASGLVTAASGVYPGTLVDLGPLVYARQESPGGDDVGHDFGIVEIPPAVYDQVRTIMPMWHGPTSDDLARQVTAGDVIVHYGNGVGVGEFIPTKGRAGVGVSADGNFWLANATAAPGDSGSAVNIARIDPDGLVVGEYTAGVLTHLVIGTGGGTVAGTTTARAVQMAAEDAGLDLSLVLDPTTLGGPDPDPDPDPDPEPEPDPVTATIEAPDRVKAGETFAVHGSGGGPDDEYAWDFGDGTTAEGPDANHTYTSPGRRTITLTVTDGDQSASASHIIRVSGPPVR